MEYIQNTNGMAIYLNCVLSYNDISIKDIDTVTITQKLRFDSGADITCMSSKVLFPGVAVEGFTKWIQENDNVKTLKNGHFKENSLLVAKNHGIDKESAAISAYAFQLKNLTIRMQNGLLELGSVPIFVSFDDRFESLLLGRDLMNLFTSTIDSDTCQLKLKKADWYDEFQKYHDKITPVEFFTRNFYNKDKIVLLNEFDLTEGITVDNTDSPQTQELHTF